MNLKPKKPRATRATKAVLGVFLDRPGEELHGFGLLDETGLRSGTLYPLLIRLENRDWLRSRWADDDAPGPRRRLYHLTGDGEIAAREMLSKPSDGKSETPAFPPVPLPETALR